MVKPTFLCGSDNRTYSSPCRLEYHNCIHHTTVRIACKGFCPCKGEDRVYFPLETFPEGLQQTSADSTPREQTFWLQTTWKINTNVLKRGDDRDASADLFLFTRTVNILYRELQSRFNFSANFPFLYSNDARVQR